MKSPILSVVGAGASGMAAAVTAARYAQRQGRNIHVVLYERLPKIGKKILATGNGRCNIMNINADLSKYYGDKKLISDIFKKYTVEDNMEFFQSMGLHLAEEDDGRLYPMSFQASSVLDALRFEIQNLGIQVVCDTKITDVKRAHDGFLLNNSIKTDALIVAGGGKSAAVQGSDGSSFSLLSLLGIKTESAFPSLVPIVLKKKNKALKGVRMHSEILVVENGRVVASSVGELQYTDYGISGIPAMEVSRAVSEHFALKKKEKIAVSVNSLPDFAPEEIFSYITDRKNKNPHLLCEDLLSGLMPKKLGIAKITSAGISPSSEIAALTKKQISYIAEMVHSEIFEITGVLGFEQSQVTAGGAKLTGFDDTLAAKNGNGLFACGEVLNVDAMCGGYNLLWAWSSGRCAGENAAKYLLGGTNNA